MPTLDHLVFTAPDLDEGVRRIEALTGVRAVAGGQHPGVGTHNALVGLDQVSYLEIIAPDPSQPQPASPRPFGLDDGGPPRLAGFAVHPVGGESVDEVVAVLRDAGFDPGPVVAMSRTTPDGDELSWHLTRPRGSDRPGDGVLPFVIDWGATPSPALSVPPVGRLTTLRLAHPDAAVRAAVRSLLPNDEIELSDGPARLEAVVHTASGPVTLS